MITPQEIGGKALRKYGDYLRSLIQGSSFFPLPIRADKKAPADFGLRHKALEALISHSKDRTGFGYSLGYRKVVTRQHGEQDEVEVVRFNTEEDYLRFLNKEIEAAEFKDGLGQLLAWQPTLKDWLLQQPPDTLLQYQPAWKGICGVVDYLLTHDVRNLYLRTLQVPVHTKFIQRYKAVIFSLLQFLQPARFGNEGHTLEEALGLRKKPHLFALRWLDLAMAEQFSAGMEVFGVSVDYLKQVAWPVKQIILVENETNLYLLPEMAGSMALVSAGGALHLLKDIPLFRNTQLYYWGDLDEKGFTMLRDVRLYYPHVISVLMDEAVVMHHQLEMDTQPHRYREHDLSVLTGSEKRAFSLLSANNGRIEQEKLDQHYMQECLAKMPEANSTGTE